MAAVFSLLGFIFISVGLPLLFVFLTGIPFALLGLVFLGTGIPILIWRYREAQRTLEVLRMGRATQGTITDVTQNYAVTVNNRHPWTVHYAFEVGGQRYEGKTTTLRPIGFTHRPGQTVYVLYLERNPERSTIYPPVV